jgi:hypothetical protein
MTFTYADYDSLAFSNWTAINGKAYGYTTSMQFSEAFVFGALNTYTGYKTIDVEYLVKDSFLIGYLYVDSALTDIKFVFGNAEKICSSFALLTGVLTISSKNPLVSTNYV